MNRKPRKRDKLERHNLNLRLPQGVSDRLDELRGSLSLNRYVVLLILEDCRRRYGLAPIEVLTE